MTNIIIIAAMASNRVIGKNNDIPWRIKEDFQHFRNLTLGFPCIMGESTYKSLPSRPLPGRENIVLTLNRKYNPEGATVFNDFNESINYVRNLEVEKAFIIGGATIYKLGIDVADYMELTFIHRDFDGDVTFPEYDSKQWELVSRYNQAALDYISNKTMMVSFETLQRKKHHV
jgi:dihydrofolate reductase